MKQSSLDRLLMQKRPHEIYMIYSMIIAALFFLSYTLLWDVAHNNFATTDTTLQRLRHQIAADKRYLQQTPRAKITSLEAEIANITDKIALYKDDNAYLKSEIETLTPLVYDAQTWGKYLDSIAKSAQKYHITINTFSNRYPAKSSSFAPLLEITLGISGTYKDTLLFINALEQSTLIVDIYDLQIQAKSQCNSDLNISLWGIKYK